MSVRPLTSAILALLAIPAMALPPTATNAPTDPAHGIATDAAQALKPPAVPASPPPAPDVTTPPIITPPQDPPVKVVVASAKQDDHSSPLPTQGVSVRVEKLPAAAVPVDPGKIKLSTPFMAKPLGSPPNGWSLVPSKSAPAITRQVEISPGKPVTLTIHPHLLLPEADGVAVFNVAEPGFDPARGYGQTSTVSAILARSIDQLEADSRGLSSVIDELQQVLISLPKPEPLPQAAPPPDPVPTPPAKPFRRSSPRPSPKPAVPATVAPPAP